MSGPGRDLLAPDPINYYDPPANLSIGNALSIRGGIDRGFYGLIDEVRVFCASKKRFEAPA